MKKGWLLGLVLLLFLISGAPAGAAPPAAVEVSVPDYEVTTVGDTDYVTIPGGEALLAEEGRPRVPYYVKTVDYPKGYRVQDVVLKEWSGAVTTTGLRLPVVVLSPNPPSPVKMKEGWYPEKDYTWQVLENPDGSTTLVIALYPFYYDPGTTGVVFYKNYKLSVNYTLSTVDITGLALDKSVCRPGEKIAVDLRLKNAGGAQDVTVSLAIKEYGADEAVAGLPLRVFKGLAGEASFSAEWSSQGTAPGYYYLEAALTDGAGNVLDRERAGFAIQAVEGGKELAEGAAEFYIGQKQYRVGGTVYAIDVAPYIKGGRTFLPVRYVGYACGVKEADIAWDAKTKTVQLRKGNVALTLRLGSRLLEVTDPLGNTRRVQMDVAPEIAAGRTMLPVRWVAEQLGYRAAWEAQTQTVRIEAGL
ncbi:MAG: copper amine oxidase N-terminal domain-containing protein [Bacillota bacterium]